MSETEIQGRCLCGKCTFRATPQKMECSVCHCETCRRWAGVQFSVDVGGSLHDAKGPITCYASSEHMNRYSCSECSAPLYRLSTGDGRYYAVMQTFDDPSAFDFTLEIFVDEKPSNYTMAGERPRLTSDQLWKMMDEKS